MHFPFRRGDFNIHTGVGGSLRAVLSDIETIWGHCIEHLLEIPKSDLKVDMFLLINLIMIVNMQYVIFIAL